MGNAYMQNREELLATLNEKLRKLLHGKAHKNMGDFVNRFFSITPISELKPYLLADLEGATLSFWQFMEKRLKNKTLIKIFNPDFEHHGWRSQYSVIYILRDDMPFIVDSLRVKLTELGINVHHIRNGVISVERNKSGGLTGLNGKNKSDEAFVYIEVTRQDEKSQISRLNEALISVMNDVEKVVSGYRPIINRMNSLIVEIDASSKDDAGREAAEYLRWLINNHFTFLGCESFNYNAEKKNVELLTSDGLLDQNYAAEEQNDPLCIELLMENKNILSFSKSSVRSTVHRPAYPDYIIIKKFNEKGELSGVVRIKGLYTSPVYQNSPRNIPYLRRKINMVEEKSGLDPCSHHGKALTQILEVFPRDELFLMSDRQLSETAMDILRIQERHQIKVFIRRDSFSVFVSVLVFVPRDTYSTELRRQIRKILHKRLNAEESEFNTYFSESSLARVHFVMRLAGADSTEADSDAIAEEIVEVSRSWQDTFKNGLMERYGESEAERLFSIFGEGFSASYKEAFSAETGVVDCEYLAKLSHDNPLEMSFYCSLKQDDMLHFKVFHYGQSLPLATLIPLMENLGLMVVNSYPYHVLKPDGSRVWVHDFSLRYMSGLNNGELPLAEEIFKEAFRQIWQGNAENDRFNHLILSTGLPWRQVAVLRAYARYLKQIHLGFSQLYIADTLNSNIELTQLLLDLFKTRFDPATSLTQVQRRAQQQQVQQQIFDQLEQVSVLSEDQILRQFLHVIIATQRTSFYQTCEDGSPKESIAFKIASEEVPGMPLPVPLFEIFVYSPRVEGIHLRGGKFARGGLRWSDRIEDFRTEVLGLVKAQQVKNAVIVPVGAKGGFVAKQLSACEGRDEMLQEGIACYRLFIRSLLDLTDNLENDMVIPPQQVVRHDEDDYYLVVAADKGTATFSDIANTIAEEYGFWLGDAFASGGSAGYDHKKIGITARGAWVSVQRHFREKGVNCQAEPISVVGIGDMSGDVFGNGLLLSPTISLLAAFNHQHIFIDPVPDIEASLKERQRLFDLPRSSWTDYDQSIISAGGSIIPRSAKSVKITKEMKEVFAIRENSLSPNDLIQAILRAPIDLLWNGGIGTYVKSSLEQHADVGDKANDNLRVNGCELRCKIVGEGGNLGLTQLGRVEYALQGGALNTDFIDNSAGVDCSDHEVNIKILLNELIIQGDMTLKQRDQLLESMTEAVSQLVLKNNYRQIQALALAEKECIEKLEEYKRFIHYLEGEGKLKRKVENLPADDVIDERLHQGKGLTRPELSVLISYSKLDLKEKLLASGIAEDAYIAKEGLTAFPEALVEKYRHNINSHRLSREIAVTQIANYMINMMGITFVSRQQQSTSLDASDIARAFVVARDIFQIDTYWQEIEQLDYQVDAEVQHVMMEELMRLMRRATRWLLRVEISSEDIESRVAHYQPKIMELAELMGTLLRGQSLERWQERKNELIAKGVNEKVASFVAGARQLYSLLYIIQAAEQTGEPLERAAAIFLTVGEKLEVHWFYRELNSIEASNHWQSMARESIRDELSFQQRSLTVALLQMKQGPQEPTGLIDYWSRLNSRQLERWQLMLNELKVNAGSDLALYTVLARELMGIAQECAKME